MEEYIVENNADPTSTHVAGHNWLSDLTEEELKKMQGGYQPAPEDDNAPVHEVKEGDQLLGDINWQGGKCVTPVKD